MTDSWKDDYREEKEASRLTWDEFHRERFVHVDDLAAAEIDRVCEHLDAVKREYRQMKRELHETRVLLDDGDGENDG
jgi:hypothetical protein